jgi:hypothetical protein
LASCVHLPRCNSLILGVGKYMIIDKSISVRSVVVQRGIGGRQHHRSTASDRTSRRPIARCVLLLQWS